MKSTDLVPRLPIALPVPDNIARLADPVQHERRARDHDAHDADQGVDFGRHVFAEPRTAGESCLWCQPLCSCRVSKYGQLESICGMCKEGAEAREDGKCREARTADMVGCLM